MALSTAAERTLDLFEVTRAEAQARMDKIVERGKNAVEGVLDHLLTMRIHDRLVPHTEMRFNYRLVKDDPPSETERKLITVVQGETGLTIHRHALSQFCTKTGLPLSYVDMLLRQDIWGVMLATHNLQELMQDLPFKKQDGKPRKFLLREVQGQIRGFLSRSYGIHFSTNPLFPRFLEECAVKDAVPIEAMMSDTRFAVKCALPYIFPLDKNEYLALGLSFHNSDFGAGRFGLREILWDPIHNRGAILQEPDSSLIDKGLRDRIHLGPRLNEEDLSLTGGERAKRTELVAQHVRDTVQAMFSLEWTSQLCEVVKKAQLLEISWPSILRRVGTTLLKEELESLQEMLKTGDNALPSLQKNADGLPIPTQWWVASAVSFLASRQTDPDRKIELQEVAGRFIQKE